jgi:predicted dehydrogenase
MLPIHAPIELLPYIHQRRSFSLNSTHELIRFTAIMTLNLALLGSGLFASNAYLPALLLPENKHVNLHTVWSRSEGSAKKLVEAARLKSDGALVPRILFGDQGLKILLDDKDIAGAMLVLPVTTQMALIPQLWAAGKHVLSEKPMAKDVKSGRDLVEQYENSYKPDGLVWRVAEGEWAKTIGVFR